MNKMPIKGYKVKNDNKICRFALAVAISFISVFFLPVTATSQERNEEVTIIAPYQPTISDALKITFAPTISTPEQPQRSFQFQYIDKQLFAPLTLEPVQPQRYSQMKEDELLRNYIKAGFGNYMTPYVELFAGSLRSEKFQVTARLKHLSSKGNVKDYGPSAYSHNLAALTGKWFLNKHTFSGNIDYNRDVYHYYGFEPDSFPSLEIDEDSLKQRFQLIGAGIAFGSNYDDPQKLSHEISLGFYNFTDRYDSRENNLSAAIGLTKGFEFFRGYPAQILGLDLGLAYFGRKDSLNAYNPLIFNITPWIDLNFDQYRIKVGFEVNAEHDSVTQVNFFPVILGELVIVPDNLKAFAELKGEKTINSFKSLADENPFIISTPEVRNSVSPFGFGGGIIGNAGGFNYLAKAYYRYVKDMPFFVNDTSLQLLNQFEVIYDNVNEFTLEAAVGYEIPKTMHVRLTGDYHAYDLKNELKAWHKPAFNLKLDGSYTFLTKYTLDAAIFLIGQAYYKDYEGPDIVAGTLSTSYDLNVGFNYQHNQYFSAFLKLNNLLNQRYYLWHRYPSQGFQVMAGLGFSF
jgi:hypothetical protein